MKLIKLQERLTERGKEGARGREGKEKRRGEEERESEGKGEVEGKRDRGRTMFLVISVSTLTSDLRLNLKGNSKKMDPEGFASEFIKGRVLYSWCLVSLPGSGIRVVLDL